MGAKLKKPEYYLPHIINLKNGVIYCLHTNSMFFPLSFETNNYAGWFEKEKCSYSYDVSLLSSRLFREAWALNKLKNCFVCNQFFLNIYHFILSVQIWLWLIFPQMFHDLIFQNYQFCKKIFQILVSPYFFIIWLFLTIMQVISLRLRMGVLTLSGGIVIQHIKLILQTEMLLSGITHD